MTDARTLVALRYARGGTVAALAIALFWHLGFDLPATVANWHLYRWPGLAAAAWAAYTAIGVLGAVGLLGPRRLVSRPLPLAAASLLVDGAVMAACTADGLLSAADWGWGSVGWLGVIICWGRRPRALVAFLTANAALMLAAMILAGVVDRISLARYLMVVVGSATLQLGYSLGTRALDLAAQWAVTGSAALAETMDRRHVAEAVHEARIRRYKELQRTTTRLLAELADGADPGDPDVQRRCAIEASRLRRLMAETDDTADPLLHELRACADIAERRGVAVVLETVGSVPPLAVETRRALAEAPMHVLGHARTEARVTVASFGGEVAVSVRADVGNEHADVRDTAGAGVRIILQREGEWLWTTTSWSAP